MRRYETIYIARPGSGEKEIESITERTTQTIISKDGSIVNVDNWGVKKLSYPIKKELQGYYVYLEYAGLPEAVSEIERLFRIDDKILRYITVKTQDVFSHIPSDDKPEETEQSEAVAEEASSKETPSEKPVVETAEDTTSEVAEEVSSQEITAEKTEEPDVAEEETTSEVAEEASSQEITAEKTKEPDVAAEETPDDTEEKAE